jgi:cytochrome b6-f complex iron-sulfur subunit
MMNRSEFLKLMGTGTILACAGCSLVSCSSSDDPSPAGNTNPVDFTLDLSLAPNSVLTNVGGALSVNGIIIARLSTTTFTALNQACTHQGTSIDFRPASADFLCPNHGSQFSSTGAVTRGPATRALRKYSTELNGTLLRIFS